MPWPFLTPRPGRKRPGAGDAVGLGRCARAAHSRRPVRRSQLRIASLRASPPRRAFRRADRPAEPASADAHPAYPGGVQVPCGRHPFALLCATSTTTSTSRWDENAVGCLIWRRYRRLVGGHPVWMSAPGPADRPQARAGSRYFQPCRLTWSEAPEDPRAAGLSGYRRIKRQPPEDGPDRHASAGQPAASCGRADVQLRGPARTRQSAALPASSQLPAG